MMTPRGWLLLLLALVPACILGLVTEETVRGRVSDSSGQPVAGAIVRWRTTSHSTVSDSLGRFVLPGGTGFMTAALPGAFIASNSLPVLVLRRLPESDDPDYRWVAPTNCAVCHDELHREWQASAHSRSATGPHFRNLYEGSDHAGKPNVGWGLLTQNPLGAAVCASCHAPAIREDDPGILDLRQLSPEAAKGVHCDYCHKVVGDRGPIDGLNHGRFQLRLQRPAPASGEQWFFGPLDDADRGDSVHSPYQRDSRFCGACHEGTVFGVPVYTTYSDWQASPAGRRGQGCVSCHLRPTGRMSNIAPGHGGYQRNPQTLANHRFFDGDAIAMLRESIALNASFASDAVAVEIVARNVGHRVPTGYIDRHLILFVEARDATGRRVEPVTGERLPRSAGVGAGRLFGRVLTDPEGRSPAPFWTARREVIDTRLTPEQPERWQWTFPPGAVSSLRVRLVYRRFWQAVAHEKGWPSVESVVREMNVALPRNPAR